MEQETNSSQLNNKRTGRHYAVPSLQQQAVAPQTSAIPTPRNEVRENEVER